MDGGSFGTKIRNRHRRFIIMTPSCTALARAPGAAFMTSTLNNKRIIASTTPGEDRSNEDEASRFDALP